jgi:hypothetical protein
VSLCANASSTREGGGWQRLTNSVVGPHPPRLARDYENFVRVSLAGIEPVGFRVKSDLRNHQARFRTTAVVRLLDGYSVRRSLFGDSREVLCPQRHSFLS